MAIARFTLIVELQDVRPIVLSSNEKVDVEKLFEVSDALNLSIESRNGLLVMSFVPVLDPKSTSWQSSLSDGLTSMYWRSARSVGGSFNSDKWVYNPEAD